MSGSQSTSFTPTWCCFVGVFLSVLKGNSPVINYLWMEIKLTVYTNSLRQKQWKCENDSVGKSWILYFNPNAMYLMDPRHSEDPWGSCSRQLLYCCCIKMKNKPSITEKSYFVLYSFLYVLHIYVTTLAGWLANTAYCVFSHLVQKMAGPLNRFNTFTFYTTFISTYFLLGTGHTT